MDAPMPPSASRISLNKHLFERAPDRLRHLILDIARAAKYIHYAIRTTEAGLAGSRNQFGEEQVKLDVLSNAIIEQHLRESRLVARYISEEQKDVVELSPEAPYSVVFDPLDGSSLVDVNFAIGSIFGVYEGEVIGKKPREQVAALYVIYGPRTVLVCSSGHGTHEFILNDVGEFILLREHLGIGDAAKVFAPGNLHAMVEDAPYRSLLEAWLQDNMSLRYSGCMVADVHHILSKGQGVFLYPGGPTYPEGKLRHVFECGPFAYLVDQAGGSSSDGAQSILEKEITAIDQRTPFIIGSKKEVERVCSFLGRV
ncbi:MAG: fructose-1,6-bisphosphatase I [Candidatus Peregrinibacteria bacterium Greene0416_19]|nr:MAG: fructose-1,6-bisphosphatase I [Candidatus Peregrinibacteria bacterium Greene0416_19]